MREDRSIFYVKILIDIDKYELSVVIVNDLTIFTKFGFCKLLFS